MTDSARSPAAELRPARLEFLRSAGAPGVEVVEVLGTSQGWQCFATAYELVVASTWAADISSGRRSYRVDSNRAFCAKPGELFYTTGIHAPGDASVLCLPEELVAEFLAERHGALTAEDVMPTYLANDDALRVRLGALADALREGADSLRCQWALFEVLEGLMSSHGIAPTDGRRAARLRTEDAATAARVREWLDAMPSGRVDLHALAAETGRSRYQVLRAFKRTYGLPPHAYNLCARIAESQRLLASGQSPAQVAIESGFVDQSHFSKHFRRQVGVTPAQYARSTGRAKVRNPAGLPSIR